MAGQSLAWPSSTRLVYAIPSTEAHLLPLYGDGKTVMCGKYVTFLRWHDDDHAKSLPVCRVCQRAV